MELYEKITEYCNENLTLHGFANLKDNKEAVFLDQLRSYDYAIAIGINIPDNIVDNLDTDEGRKKYLEAYTQVNNLLNENATNIVEIIRQEGYNSVNVDSSYILPGENFVGEISHKLVANLAGLGWIGKSALFINPYYGPRVRWATILTDAPLPVENKRMKSRCKSCRLCVENCPVNAFKDKEFDENVSRDERYDAGACASYFDRLESMGKPRLCGLCVKVCPWGLVNKNSRIKEDII